MGLLLTGNNIAQMIGREVFDPVYRTNVALGRIDSVFYVSGLPCAKVFYILERHVINNEGQMSGLIVNGPVIGSIGPATAYIDYQGLVEKYEDDGNDLFRGYQFLAMTYSTIAEYIDSVTGSGYINTGVFGTQQDRIVSKVYYSGMIDYYAPEVAAVSGLPSTEQLILR